ncbi:MAG: ABC-type transport auxiliary lipoprotein family protein [Nitrosomonadaceae bacterium]
MRKLYVLLSIWLAGCTIMPQAQTPVSIYDFGLQQVSSTYNTSNQQQQLWTSLLIAEATSPVWLDSQAIQYRLAYRDPTQSYNYANNRWAAAPATLLTHRIRNRIAAVTNDKIVSTSDGTRADFTLRLELEEFSQVFDAVDKSHVIIRLRASLIHRSSRSLRAQRNFSMEQATPTANAAGAVQALTESSDKLIENLIDWLTEELAREEENY